VYMFTLRTINQGKVLVEDLYYSPLKSKPNAGSLKENSDHMDHYQKVELCVFKYEFLFCLI